MGRHDLTGRDRLIVAALLAAPTRKDAARIAGVADSTVARRLRTPAFLQMLDEAVTEIAQGALRQALQARPEAIESLKSAMNNPRFPPAVRVTAASRLYEIGLRHEEQADLRARLDRLEKAQEEMRGGLAFGAPQALPWSSSEPIDAEGELVEEPAR